MKVIREELAAGYGGPRRSRVSTAEAVFLAKLGHDLRSMYTEVVREPLPDALAGLVDRLAAAGPERGRDAR